MHIGNGFSESKYLLVLKDMATHYCELVPCSIPNAQIAADAMLMWNARFGLPSTWLSDQGTHFRNATIEAIRLKTNTKQLFTPAYSSWINGAIERLNRDIIKLLQVFLLEFKVSTQDWEYFIPCVLYSLNRTPRQSLAGYGS